MVVYTIMSKAHTIKVEFDGVFPNMCSGKLIVTVDGVRHVFGPHALCSGGSAWIDIDANEVVSKGKWSINPNSWPERFDPSVRKAILKAINDTVPHGCCGGCI